MVRSQPVLITQGLVLRGEKGAGVVVQAMELRDMRADPVLAEAAGALRCAVYVWHLGG